MRFSAATMYKRTCINGPLYGTDGQTRRQRPRTISNPVSLIGSLWSRDCLRLVNASQGVRLHMADKIFLLLN